MSEAQSTESPEPAPMKTLADSLSESADWVPEPLQPVWAMLADYPVLQAACIAVLFFFLAFVVRALVLNNLERLSARSSSTVDDTIIAGLKRPVFNTIFFFGLILAVQAAQPPFGRSIFINIIASMIVVSWMLAGLNLSSTILQALGRNRAVNLVEERTIPLFDLTAKLALLLVASYVLLLIWGINPVGWLASAGIVGIAVGFAAKDTLANLFSGFFILADAPYKIGDYINLDTGERGKVVAIGMRSTRLLTRDDIEITVPNAVIANAKITNESGGPYEKMRVRIDVGVAYGSDLEKVCAVLQKVAEAEEGVCAMPEPRVRARGFGASSVDFQLLAWIDRPENRGLINHKLYMHIYKALNESGIEIPYTKQDLYIKEMPEAR